MSVKIRLTVTGKTHQISYRLVAQDTHTKRDGKFLEILGNYNPRDRSSLKIHKDRIDFWVQKGAKLTPAVEKLVNLKVSPKAS